MLDSRIQFLEAPTPNFCGSYAVRISGGWTYNLRRLGLGGLSFGDCSSAPTCFCFCFFPSCGFYKDMLPRYRYAWSAQPHAYNAQHGQAVPSLALNPKLYRSNPEPLTSPKPQRSLSLQRRTSICFQANVWLGNAGSKRCPKPYAPNPKLSF